MLNWHELLPQLRQFVKTSILLAKSRRHEEAALGLAVALFAIGVSFNKWLPETLQTFVSRWHGDVIVPVAFCTAGLISLSYGIYRFWKLTYVSDLPPPANRPSAIKGPLAFTPTDGELFRRLGREDELRKLLGYIQDDQIRLIVLMGASGVGKTSLLRAGLTDILKGTGIKYHYWEAVASESERGLLTAIQQSWEFTPDDEAANVASQQAPGLKSLEELLNPALTVGRHVIVLDQFEQLSATASGAVFRLLRKVAREARPPHRVTWVIAFRREFRANWSDFIIPEHEHGFYPPELSLRQFTSEQARDVIGQLIQAAGLSVEQKVINNLTEAATVEGEVSSVDIGIGLLVLAEIYGRQGAKTLTQDIYYFAGGAEGLLTQYINRCLEGFPDEDRKALLSAMLALCDAETNQRLAEGKTCDELATEIEATNVRRLKNQLERLTQRDIRLLEHIAAPKDGALRYRLPHERLIPALNRLAGKLIGELQEAKLKFISAYSAWKVNQSPQYLLKGSVLRLVERHQRKISWGKESADKLHFFTLSQHHRTQRRISLGLLLLVPLALTVWDMVTQKTWQHSYPDELADYQRHLKVLELDSSFFGLVRFDFLDSDTLEELHIKVGDNTDLESLRKYLARCPKMKKLGLNFYDEDQVKNLSLLPDNLAALALNLNGIEVEELPPFPKSLTDLTLNLRFSDVRRLPSFPNKLTKLTLDLTNSEVTELPPLPATLTDITLNLGASEVEKLPPSWPNNLAALTLDLTNSKVKELPPLPNTLTKLSLKLNGNVVLESLPDSLTELDLNLDFNQMKKLPPLPKTITKLTLLQYDDLAAPRWPDNLTDLTLIPIRYSMENLPPLPDALTKLTLDLSYAGNRMATVPPLPDNLNNLTALSLKLTNCRAKELPPLRPTLKDLNLDLKDSSVELLPSWPEGLTALSLKLSNCKVKELPPLPNTLTSLALDLGSSDVQVLPRLPDNLTTLSLDLGFSKVRELPPLPNTLTDVALALLLSKVKVLPPLSQLKIHRLSLELDYEQRKSLKAIPKSVTHLKF